MKYSTSRFSVLDEGFVEQYLEHIKAQKQQNIFAFPLSV